MKVLFVNNLYPPHDLGGGGKSLAKLCEAFPAVNVEPVVATLTPEPSPEVERISGTTVYRIPLANLYWPFTERGHPRFGRPFFNLIDRYNPIMADRVGEVIEQESPDLVRTKNVYGFSTAVWSEARASHTPTVHTLGDYYLICLHASLVRDGTVCETQCGDCRLWTAGQSSRSQRVNGVTGVSQFVLDKHRSFGYFQATDHREVIPPPMDPIEKEADSNTTYSNPLMLGYLGRLVPDKGVNRLVEAVSGLSDADLQLQVGGTGPSKFVDGLRERADQSAVQFHGRVESGEFLRDIDLLAVPSRIPETFGRVVVEAFRQGIPVITTGRGALGDLVEHGENGWVVEGHTVDAWKAALRRFVESPEDLQRMAGRGRDWVERCDTDRVVRQYYALFESILDGSSSEPHEQCP